MRYRLLYRHFWNELIEERLARGEIPITEHKNGGYSYSGDLDWEGMNELDRRIAGHLDHGEDEVRALVAPIREIHLRALDQRVTEALATLEESGIYVLEDELFPEWERLTRQPLQMEDVCRFLEKAYSMAFKGFLLVIEHNFPRLYRSFPSVGLQPITAILSVRLETGKRAHLNSATIYLCQGSGSENRFIARPDSQVLTSFSRDPSWRFEVEVNGEKYVRLEVKAGTEFIGQRGLALYRILSPGDHYLDRNNHSSWSGTSIPSILRTLVYDWLRKELPAAFAELCRTNKVEMDHSQWIFFPRPS